MGQYPGLFLKKFSNRRFQKLLLGLASQSFQRDSWSLVLMKLPKVFHCFFYLMRSNDANQFSRKQLVFLLKISFSEKGTIARKYENGVYAVLTKYVRESAGARRGAITLGSILQFATGLDEEPPLGFELEPCMPLCCCPCTISLSAVSIFDPESLVNEANSDRLIDSNDLLLHNSSLHISLTNIFSFFINRV